MKNLLNELDMEYSSDIPQVQVKYPYNLDKSGTPTITCPDDAYKHLISIWDLDTLHYREEFCVLLLNNCKECFGWSKISIGGSTATIVDPAKIYQVALLTNAHSIILAHNHPSGHSKASSADINLTKRLNEIGKTIGIPVNDHLILTGYSYLSMRDQGLF